MTRDTVRTIVLTGVLTLMVTIVITWLSFTTSGAERNSDPVQILASDIPFPVWIHLATVVPSVPLGAYVLWRRKGDAWHRRLGKLWAALMLTTAATGFFIHSIGDGLSFIHIFSAWTLAAIPYAVWQVRNGKIEAHRRTMRGVYIGLCTAGLFALLPGRATWGLLIA